MTNKDKAIAATDLACQAITALIRLNYDNPLQVANNMKLAAVMLEQAKEKLIR